MGPRCLRDKYPLGRHMWIFMVLIGLFLLVILSGCNSEVNNRNDSKQAFLKAYDVLMHPRCLNCHPKGDQPLQGDDNRPHGQNVQRGDTGHGKYALKCTNCHMQANRAGAHMPPGVPNWHMPPADMPMVFEGRSPGELCRQLQDLDQNGGMDMEDMMTHVEDDALVIWGWEPGEGRTKPSISHAEFVKAMEEWITKGAACPD